MKAYPSQGESQKNSRKIFNDITKEEIRQLREKGWTLQQIADKYYCAIETIRRYCNEY
jgi:DNA invertase Pin-like site-specific DNA recombinase